MTVADPIPTLAKARLWAADELRRTGAESCVLSADILLGFVLGRERVYLLCHGEEVLSDEDWQLYRSCVLRHARGEPLQYLIGEREFYGLDFHVTPSVLIPRPETEILVETALEIARGQLISGPRYADVGTGSGCIAVALAHHLPEAAGYATDISGGAIRIAKSNAERHGVAARIEFVRTNLMSCFRAKPFFDLILSNPPYVELDGYDTLARGVRDYEPHLALFGGRDGMDLFRRLAPEASLRLKPGGFLLLEIGAGQLGGVQRLMANEGLLPDRSVNDLQGIPRCAVFRKGR
jgi:release factor glutamine methyltransferase